MNNYVVKIIPNFTSRRPLNLKIQWNTDSLNSLGNFYSFEEAVFEQIYCWHSDPGFAFSDIF